MEECCLFGVINFSKNKKHNNSMDLGKMLILLCLFAVFGSVKSQSIHLSGTQILSKYNWVGNSINSSLSSKTLESSDPKKKISTKDQIKKYTKILKDEHNKSLIKIIGLSSSLTVLVVVLMWLFFSERDKKIKDNYHLALEALKDKPASTYVKKNTDAALRSNYTETNNIIKDRINISEDTEKKLLKKLAAFEASERFLKKELTLTALASQKGTNPKYLSKIIHTHRNQTFTGYINKLRMNYIIQKLYDEPKYREYKISYLADECGYTSPQVFVVVFKKETGLTPSSFIEQLKTELDNYNNMLIV